MAGKTVIVWTCAHSDPKVSNERFDWLGRLIYDIRPDYCVDLGDFWDMRSLNTYDTRYPESYSAQSYEKDIDHGNDAQERIRHVIKKNKVKRPSYFGFEGNHEYRIKKAIKVDPRLAGDKHGISFSHLETGRWYDDYHEYEHDAPAVATYDGVDYAHYISGGNYGTALSGEHHAYNLLKKRMNSATVGHSHKRNIYFRDDAKKIGLVAGCFTGAPESWAGQANDEWAVGVWVLRNLENGFYEPQWISIQALEEEYA